MTPERRRLTSPAALVAAACVLGAAVLLRRMSPDDPGRTPQRPPSNDRRAHRGPPAEPAVLARLADWVPRRPETRLGRVLAYVWASPLTAIGCILGGVSRADASVADGVVVFSSARGPMGVVLRRRGFTATALGHAIVTTAASPSAALLAHELVHTRQAERLGLLFGPAYVALLAWYGYRQHPLERAARKGAAGGDGRVAPRP